MKNRNIIIILILSLIVSFCSSDTNRTQKRLYLSYLNELNIDIKEDACIIIVSKEMCHSCVREALKALNGMEDKRKMAVLAGYSKKGMQQSFMKFQNIDFISDSRNLLGNIKYQQINHPEPVFIQIEDNKVKKLVFIPFDQLEESLEQIK